MLRKIVLLGFSVAVSGCAVFGESEFTCNAPEGVSCQSISGGYANAAASSIPGQKVREDAGSAQPNKNRAASRGFPTPEDKLEEVESAFTLVSRTSVLKGGSLIDKKPRELRSKEQVVAVTVFPWQDDAGTLHDVSRFFFVIKDSDWNVNYTKEVNRKSFGNIRDFRNIYAR